MIRERVYKIVQISFNSICLEATHTVGLSYHTHGR